MPRRALGAGARVEPGLDYANNGKVSAVYCVNNTGGSVHVEVQLTDGRIFEWTFAVGETSFSVPANALSISVDAAGEYTYTGLAQFRTRTPG